MTKPYIWITGASTGIGRSLAIEFVKNGFNVFATSRKKELLVELENFIDSDGLITFQSDVSVLSEVERAYAFLKVKNGEVACLINNAGISTFTAAKDDPIETIERIIQTNLLGSIYVIKTVLPEMMTRKEGWIISILSIVTRKVFTNSSAYAASKMGLLGYTNSLREEVRKDNIKVLNVFPGATETYIWSEAALQKHSSRMMKSDDVAKLIVSLYKQKGSAIPEEIMLRPQQGDL